MEGHWIDGWSRSMAERKVRRAAKSDKKDVNKKCDACAPQLFFFFIRDRGISIPCFI